ncbi:hypothetical protein WA158_007858 [Blastocystis sp. Blastoise]
MKTILLLLLPFLFVVCQSSCAQGEVELSIRRDYSVYPENEVFEIWNPSETTQSQLFVQRGNETDVNTSYTWTLCTKQTEHLLVLKSIDGSGWKSQKTNSLITITIFGIPIISKSMEITEENTLYTTNYLFNTKLYVFEDVLFRYKDTIAEDPDWKTKEPSTWPQVTHSTVPSMTNNVRYYTLTIPLPTDINSYDMTLIIRTEYGFISYVNGQEMIRHKLPLGTIDPLTNSTSPNDSIPQYISSNIPLSLLTGSSIYIAIEVHQYIEYPPSHADPFDVYIYMQPLSANVCKPLFESGSSICTYDGTKDCTENCHAAFNTISSSSLYYPNVTTVILDYFFNDNITTKNFYWSNQYSVTSSFSYQSYAPTSWTLIGYNGNQRIVLDIRQNMTFIHPGETLTFNYNYNSLTFDHYQLIIEESVPRPLSINSFQIYSCSLPSSTILPPSPTFQYPNNNTIHYIIGEDNLSIQPIDSIYTNVTADPEFPAGIYINPKNGFIYVNNLLANSLDYIYNISAININTYTSESLSLHIHIEDCYSNGGYLYIFKKVYNSHGNEESFSIESESHELLYTSPSVLNIASISHTFCLYDNSIYIHLYSMNGNGWDPKSYLYISLKSSSPYGIQEKPDNYQRLFLNNGYHIQYSLYIHPQIPHYDTNWNITMNKDIKDWYVNNPQNNTFIPYIYEPVMNSTSTNWYFRKNIYINNITQFDSVLFKVAFRYGMVIYINEKKWYSHNLPGGSIVNASSIYKYKSERTMKSFSGLLKYFKEGNNLIAIGIVNSIYYPVSTVDFTLFMLLSTSSSSLPPYSKIDSISASGSTENIEALTDMSTKTDCLLQGQFSILIDTFFEKEYHYVNKYCITSNTYNQDYDPFEWKVQGIYMSGAVRTLDKQSNIIFNSRQQTKCFYINLLTSTPFDQLTIEFLKSYHSSKIQIQLQISISEIQWYIEDVSSLILSPFTISPLSSSLYYNVPFNTYIPSDIHYQNYTYKGLEEYIEYDSHSGIVIGKPYTDHSIPFNLTITALDFYENQYNTTVSYITSTCPIPMNLFTIAIQGSSLGEGQGLSIEDSNHTIIYNVNSVRSSLLNYYSFCHLPDLFTIHYISSIPHAWDEGYLNIYIDSSILVYSGSYSKYDLNTSESCYLGYYITPLYNIYNFTMESVDPDWILFDYDDSDWSIVSQPSPIYNEDIITFYYRMKFMIYSLIDIEYLYLSISSYGGSVVYINNKEVYRYNLPDGPINSTTYALETYNNRKTYGIPLDIHNITLYISNTNENILAIEKHRSKEDDIRVTQLTTTLSGIPSHSRRSINMNSQSNLIDDLLVHTLIDNNKNTIYINGPQCEDTIYSFGYKDKSQDIINQYSITFGLLCNRRHPSNWNLEGSNDNITWSILHIAEHIYVNQSYATYVFNIPNQKSYNQYRIVINECNNIPFENDNDIQCQNSVINHSYGIQISDISLYYHKQQYTCDDTIYGKGIQNQYSYINCGPDYIGYFRRLCYEGQYLSIENTCTYYPQTYIEYKEYSYIVYRDLYFEIIPIIRGKDIHISISPSLPQGVTINSQGVISGISSNTLFSTIYTIQITNKKSTSTTKIQLTINIVSCYHSGEWPNTPIGKYAILPCKDSDYYSGERRRFCELSYPPSWKEEENLCRIKAPILLYPKSIYTFFVNNTITPIIPYIGGLLLSNISSTSLPKGITIDSVTGIISGTPIHIQNGTIIISISNPTNSTSFSIEYSITYAQCLQEKEWPASLYNDIIYIPCGNNQVGYQYKQCDNNNGIYNYTISNTTQCSIYKGESEIPYYNYLYSYLYFSAKGVSAVQMNDPETYSIFYSTIQSLLSNVIHKDTIQYINNTQDGYDTTIILFRYLIYADSYEHLVNVLLDSIHVDQSGSSPLLALLYNTKNSNLMSITNIRIKGGHIVTRDILLIYIGYALITIIFCCLILYMLYPYINKIIQKYFPIEEEEYEDDEEGYEEIIENTIDISPENSMLNDKNLKDTAEIVSDSSQIINKNNSEEDININNKQDFCIDSNQNQKTSQKDIDTNMNIPINTN